MKLMLAGLQTAALLFLVSCSVVLDGLDSTERSAAIESADKKDREASSISKNDNSTRVPGPKTPTMIQADEENTWAHRALLPCPPKPNCVSSLDRDSRRFVEPLTFTGRPDVARIKLLDVIKSLKKTRIVESDALYIHAEFVSSFFKFVDDVEFLIDVQSQTIQVRSASRRGYFDFGVNRNRIETIRNLFNQRARPQS